MTSTRTIDWPLTDGRVTLRPATMDDAEAFFAFWRLPEVQQWTGRCVHTLDETRADLSSRLDNGDLVCAVEVEGQVVGNIGGRWQRAFSHGEPPTDQDFVLGYRLDPRVWGQGIATAAVRLLVAALHDQAGVRRIKAMVYADNVASLRVLLRCGFVLEGTERQAVLSRDGEWLDDCTLAHLPTDPR